MQNALQKRPGTQNDGRRVIFRPGLSCNAANDPLSVFRLSYQPDNLFLTQRQVRLLFAEVLGFVPIEGFIRLSARPLHGGTFAPVEHSELNPGLVDKPSHDAAQSVDFANDLPFSDAPDRRVAAHHPDCIEVPGQQRSFRANSSGGAGCFYTSVSAANDQNVKTVFRTTTHISHYNSNRRKYEGGRAAKRRT